jgi:hypothetical protein
VADEEHQLRAQPDEGAGKSAGRERDVPVPDERTRQLERRFAPSAQPALAAELYRPGAARSAERSCAVLEFVELRPLEALPDAVRLLARAHWMPQSSAPTVQVARPLPRVERQGVAARRQAVAQVPEPRAFPLAAAQQSWASLVRLAALPERPERPAEVQVSRLAAL